MKEKYKKYKEFMSVPKNKSLTLIVFYVIFFAFVFVVLSTGKTVQQPVINNDVDNNTEQNIDNKIKEVKSYEISYEFNIDDKYTIVNGIFYNDDMIFTINNEKYYIKEGSIYTSNNQKIESFEYPLLKFKYSIMDNIINNYKYETKTEYKDGNIKYEYIIPIKEFSQYYNEGNINEGNVLITITKNDYISQIDVDLKEYYNVNNYLVTIKYSNINGIESLDINND